MAMQVCCVLRPLVCGMLSWYTFAQLAMLLHVMASTDNTLHSACGLQLHSCSMYPSRHVGQAHTWQPSKQTHYGTENGAHAGTGANQGGTEPARAGAHTTATWSGLTLHAIHPITLKGQTGALLPARALSHFTWRGPGASCPSCHPCSASRRWSCHNGSGFRLACSLAQTCNAHIQWSGFSRHTQRHDGRKGVANAP